MKITFVTPPYDIIRNAYGSRSGISYGNMPPLGILYMAAEVRKHGHEVQLVDAASSKIGYEDILRKIKEFGSDIVGISTMTPSARSAYDLIHFIKGKLDLPIVLGGVHVNTYKETIFDDIKDVDLLCIGEGERTIVDILKAYDQGLGLSEVKGIAYRDTKGKVVVTQPRDLAMDLDSLALPARDLLDNSLYRLLPLSFKREPVTSMITSRGCPYGKCSFCFQAGNKAFKYRRHSPEYVLREIEETIIPNGIKEIAFWDDYFLINSKWIDRFCELIEKHDLAWTCYGYVKTATRDMLKRIKSAGCWAVLYGLESGDQGLLDVINKGITIEDSIRAVRMTHEEGLDTRATFMIALPGETPALAKKTINFAIKLNLTMVNFMPTFPEEGTKLYDIAKEKGRISKYRSRAKAVYVPDGYRDEKEVENMLGYAYFRYYFRIGFIFKHLKRIRSLADIKHYYSAMKFLLGLLSNIVRSSNKPD